MNRSRRRSIFPVTLSLVVCIWLLGGLGEFPAIGQQKQPTPKDQGYAGSVSCRECHERFYQLWSTSRHGLAMQPYTADGTYEKQGKKEEADKIYEKALETYGIPEQDKFRIRAQLEALKQGKAGTGKK